MFFFFFSTLLPLLARSQFTIGDKPTGVQMFQWKFTDIKAECVNFLGPKGYGYVQVGPVQEHIKDYTEIMGPEGENPWYTAYQPTGYSIGNRLGTEAEFIDMIQTCNSVGVKTVVDVVLNHFVQGDLNETSTSWGSELSWVSTSFNQDFPSPGYTAEHFNDNLCTGFCDWGIYWEVIYCRLFGLVDVKLDHPYVITTIQDFLNKMTGYGAYGFRIDASKSMESAHLETILSGINNNFDNIKPFIIHEMMYGYQSGEGYGAYENYGRITDMEYAKAVGQTLRNLGGLVSDNIFSEMVNTHYGKDEGSKTVVFLENHDKERDEDGEYNLALSNVNNAWNYNQAIVYNILYPRGLPIVHSGYRLLSKRIGTSTEDPMFPPADVEGYVLPITFTNGECQEEWMCQHRWTGVYPLIQIRNKADLTVYHHLPKVSTTGFESNQIYWSLNNVYFAVINSKQDPEIIQNMDTYLQTGLPAGIYCNVVYAEMVNGVCTLLPGVQLLNGEKVEYTVYSDGKTRVQIDYNASSRAVVLFNDPSSRVVSVNPKLNIEVVHASSPGDNVYIVGSMNDWDTCTARPCMWTAGDVWTCGDIELTPNYGYTWKVIKYGLSPCESPMWLGSDNYANINTDTNVSTWV